MGVLLVQTFRGRAALVLSALAFATGAVIRPHIVLFLPVLALAIDESVRPPGGPPWRSVRTVFAWGLLFAALLGLLFLPLIASGLLGDLIRGVRVARYGGTYSHRTLAEAAILFALRARDQALPALGRRPDQPDPRRRPGGPPAGRSLADRPGIRRDLAPLHPVSHGYLYHPLQLILAINLALIAGLVREKLRDSGALVTFAMAAADGRRHQPEPDLLLAHASLQAFGLLARGEMPPAPAGRTPRYRPTEGAH